MAKSGLNQETLYWQIITTMVQNFVSTTPPQFARANKNIPSHSAAPNCPIPRQDSLQFVRHRLWPPVFHCASAKTVRATPRSCNFVLQLIEKHLNPVLTVSTILLTMYDGRTNLSQQVAADVRENFPDQVLDTMIPRSVRISEAPGFGQTVISYDTNSPGALSYLEAAAEIAHRGAPK